MGAFENLNKTLPSELKLVVAALGIYGSFLYWGYLQEKITMKDAYVTADGIKGTWDFSSFMNVIMSIIATGAAAILVALTPQAVKPPSLLFLKPAACTTLAGVVGFYSLRFINFPLLVLGKSCKLVPVMLMGALIGGKRYPAKDYAAVALITVGVAAFSMKPGKGGGKGGGGEEEEGAALKLVAGLLLVGGNLLLSGMTSAYQDKINDKYPALTPFYMMQLINFWISVLSFAFLGGAWAVLGAGSELSQALTFCATHPEALKDLVWYGVCGAVGQLFIFYIINEFGSLTNTIVTVTRKFFSILISVVAFGHQMALMQWVGVSLVFAGLSVNIVDKIMKNKNKNQPKKSVVQKDIKQQVEDMDAPAATVIDDSKKNK